MAINNCINDPVNVHFKNMIIGGNFDTNPWQRGISFVAVTSGAVTADRWKYWKSGTMVHTLTKSANAPSASQAGMGLTNSLSLSCTTAEATLAVGDYTYVSQNIEGYILAPYIKKKMTLSFWVYSSVAGSYSAFAQNADASYSCVMPFSIQSPNTWKKIVLTIPDTTLGVWNTTTGIGMKVGVCIGSGATFATSTTNTWVSGNYIASNTQINSVATVGNVFAIDLVQLEVGNIPTDFENLSAPMVLSLCQRYFEKSFLQGITPARALNSFAGAVTLPGQNGPQVTTTTYYMMAVKRSAPSVTFYNPKNNNANAYNSTAGSDCTLTLVISGASSDHSVPIQTTTPGTSFSTDIIWVQLTMNSEL